MMELLAATYPSAGYGFRFSSRLWTRWQASRHCCFVMCVALSQKPMQSCSVLPPPPGVLGAAELVAVPDVEVVADLSALADPPPEGVVASTGGDNGATGGCCCAEIPMAEEGGVVAVVCEDGEVCAPVLVPGVVASGDGLGEVTVPAPPPPCPWLCVFVASEPTAVAKHAAIAAERAKRNAGIEYLIPATSPMFVNARHRDPRIHMSAREAATAALKPPDGGRLVC
jgi:hypothetical protein